MNNYFLSKNLDKFIPNVLLDQAPEFIEFFKTYLNFLSSVQNMDVLSRIDLDFIPDEYLENLKWEYAHDIPLSNETRSLTSTETKQLLRDIIHLNKNKGTVNSIEFLFRVLFHSTLEVEFGRYGSYLEYKPLDYKITIIDPLTQLAVSDPQFNKLSYQPFYVSNEQDRVGFSTTYFKNHQDDTDHIWVLESSKIHDGDVLFFYNSNTYVKVETTNKLQLDGWLSQDERWKDTNNFYVLDEVNSRVDDVFFREVNGYDKVTSLDVIEDSADLNFYLSFQQGRLEIIKTGEVTTTTPLSRSFVVIKDNVNYTVTIQFSVTPTGIDSVLINGVDHTEEFVNGSGKLTIPTSKFLGLTGIPAVSTDELKNTRDLIAAFSIFFKTDVNPQHYMEIIRKNVVPAGYRLVHINFFLSTLLGNIATLEEEPTYKIKYADPFAKCALPSVTIDSIKYGDDWFDAFYRIDDLGNAQLFNFDPKRVEYQQECVYGLSTHNSRAKITRTSNAALLLTPTFEEFMATIGSTDTMPYSTMLKIDDFVDIKINISSNKYIKDPILFVVSPQARVS